MSFALSFSTILRLLMSNTFDCLKVIFHSTNGPIQRFYSYISLWIYQQIFHLYVTVALWRKNRSGSYMFSYPLLNCQMNKTNSWKCQSDYIVSYSQFSSVMKWCYEKWPGVPGILQINLCAWTLKYRYHIFCFKSSCRHVNNVGFDYLITGAINVCIYLYKKKRFLDRSNITNCTK